MIVPMKKLTLLCLEADREKTLDALRDLGVLHLAPAKPPEGRDVDALRKTIEAAEHARTLLREAQAAAAGPSAAGEAPAPAPAVLVEEAARLARSRKEQADRLETLARERAAVEPFGEFEPARVEALTRAGLSVKFCRGPAGQPLSVPAGAHACVTREDGSGRYVVLVGKGEIPWDGVVLAPPARALSAITGEQARLEQGLASDARRLGVLAQALPALATHIEGLRESLDYAEARAGMGQGPRVAWLQGFCPGEAVPAVRAQAAARGWGLVVAEPAADERVPTLVRPPRWARPIMSLFELIKITPGYREVDVSTAFLLFLSLFYAMIIGDAGYGLVFLALTLFARRKLPKAAPEPFRLMTIFSVSTVVWGLLSGAYFGMTGIPGPLKHLRIEWLNDNQNVMHLCLVIGAIHLSLAHLWNMLRMLRSTQAIAQAGWTSITWTMFFAARAMLLTQPFPGWYIPIAAVGLLAVLVFMTPWNKLRTDWVNHVMLPLTLMSNFGDILSYLRLFALGVAGLRLAGAFNSMAGTLGFGSPWRGLVAALILFAGHSLNIALGAVSVLVHGVRLNALEFSMHFGLEWAGIPYAPFRWRRSPPEGAGVGGEG